VGLEYTIVAVTCSLLEAVWGFSCDDLVLAREPTQDLFSADPVLGEVDLRWPGAGLSRGELAEGTVRPRDVLVS
jgi:hypothetical protein